MNRCAARISSALALAAAILFSGIPARAAAIDFSFQGKTIAVQRLVDQQGGRAIAIDDPGLRTLLSALGATIAWQQGQRYILITTAEPAIVSFALGDRRYDTGPVTQNAPFAPFLLEGKPFVPFDELLHALGIAIVSEGGQQILQPQLTSLDITASGSNAKLVARGGIPLDAKIVSQSDGKIVLAFDGVASALPPSRTIAGSPVRRIDARTQGTPRRPRTLVTLTTATGSPSVTPGTDDQRDFYLAFGDAPQATLQPSPANTAGDAQHLAQVTAVQSADQNGALAVRIAVGSGAAYEWHRLRPPDNRMWVDIHNARLAIPPGDQPGNALVSGVRVHQQSRDTVRVALSLAAFQSVDINSDDNGINITVNAQLADDTAPRAGSGTVGGSSVAVNPAASPGDWKFSPKPASTYVPSNPRLIVLDPGHGGSDPGSARADLIEKNIALDIATRVREILVHRGWQVMMTRSTDRDVYAPNDSATDELQARDDVANNNGARMFVSIHANAFMNSGPHGATVYYYKPSDYALAQALDRRIGSQVQVKDDGIVKYKLYVVHHADMPAALVETAYVSNPDDRLLLQNPAWRQAMAQAIADGIQDYAGPPPPANQTSGQ